MLSQPLRTSVIGSYPFPGWLETVLGRLADTIAPLALLSVGSQLRLDSFARNRHTLSLGLTFKLVLAPLILAPFYLGLPASLHDTARITLLEAAMAPMIGGGIVAMQHGLNPPLVSLMIGLGIPLSMVTVPLWWYLMQRFG